MEVENQKSRKYQKLRNWFNSKQKEEDRPSSFSLNEIQGSYVFVCVFLMCVCIYIYALLLLSKTRINQGGGACTIVNSRWSRRSEWWLWGQPFPSFIGIGSMHFNKWTKVNQLITIYMYIYKIFWVGLCLVR